MATHIDFEPEFIRVYSDLHLERTEFFIPPKDVADSRTLLVLAGDIGNFFSIIDDSDSSYYLKFLTIVSSQFPHTVLVPGNNEYAFADLDIRHKVIKVLHSKGIFNVHICDNETLHFGNKLNLIGSCLFFDLNNGCEETLRHYSELKHTVYDDNKHRFDPHVNCQLAKSYIKSECRKLPTSSEVINVLVTHYPPSYELINQYYAMKSGAYIMGGYNAADLDDVINSGLFNLVIWGHAHETYISRDLINNRLRYLVTNSRGNQNDANPNVDFDITCLLNLKVFTRN